MVNSELFRAAGPSAPSQKKGDMHCPFGEDNVLHLNPLSAFSPSSCRGGSSQTGEGELGQAQQALCIADVLPTPRTT